MQILQSRQLEEPSECPYLPGRVRQYEYFLAAGATLPQMSALLAHGWRRFGICFFRPACPGCRSCIPLRVPVAAFRPSRSQRRVLRRGGELETRFGPLAPDPDVFGMFRRHSRARFAQESDWDEFLLNFHLPACPGLQGEVRHRGALVGAGFLDLAGDALSSVYFCFEPAYARFSPGIFGALRELDEARRRGLAWYYLGYYVPGCPRMAYKDAFRPRQHFDWESGRWLTPVAGRGADG